MPCAIPISTNHLSSNRLSQLFDLLYGSSINPFWLDSSKEASAGHPGYHHGKRVSYMGNFNTNGSAVIDYKVNSKTLSIRKLATESSENKLIYQSQLNPVSNTNSLFDWIEDFNNSLAKLDHFSILGLEDNQYSEELTQFKYDYGYCGGLVGYFGYEMKSESLPNYTSTTNDSLNYPDSSFGFPDRFVTIDHNNDILWLVGIVNNSKSELDTTSPLSASSTLGQTLGCSFKDFMQWSKQTFNELTQFNGLFKVDDCLISSPSPAKPLALNQHLRHHNNFKLDLEDENYAQRIKEAQALITEGETYEVCLTTQLRLNPTLSACPWTPLELYYTLRQSNPAPFSAFLNLPQVSICSSSPEQFLRVDAQGELVMKPIKGTVQRCRPDNLRSDYPNLDEIELQILADEKDLKLYSQLQNSTKDKAENLMIVDLIRNDLTTIAVPHSVKVPQLMKVESYETVHQMVTTVKAQLLSDQTGVNAVRRCFPPGSMTGAPKLRTCEILDELESHTPRGIYSGALGYISLSGALDFSVVIRTVVVDGKTKETTVGAGGAIIIMSECEDEYEEMLTKAYSTVTSINQICDQFID
jgi:para-aminobenzoate synthetase